MVIEEEYVTPEEFAKEIGKNPATIYRWINTGIIGHIKIRIGSGRPKSVILNQHKADYWAKQERPVRVERSQELEKEKDNVERIVIRKELLELAYEKLLGTEDCGPPGQGWKSKELEEVTLKIGALLDK